MKLRLFLTALATAGLMSASAQRVTPDLDSLRGGQLSIQPIMHASLVLNYQGKNIYIDPTGGAALYEGLLPPDLIMITDIHPDHMDPKTIEAINTKEATFVVPQAVADKLPSTIDKKKIVILNNGKRTTEGGVLIESIPMYNLPESPTAMHTKGRGNGYVLTMAGKKIYISGDTADIPEMKALKDIDLAFICMNLPYTMDVKTAAAAVLAFKPKEVYPYHYRGQDTEEFKRLVNAGDKNIDVRLRNWYQLPVK
ncbi:MBL fold metallo-hydrolase [Mucilaginibacter antarcticus]|uniref:MBL fold metallo-hydrolase n=2 Tax=Mucilaginibacter antarcticus TaxID=1855725 RepID=A0ABW5XT42_9SPHI